MKKVILTLSLILAIACVFTACDQFPWQPTEKDDEITVEGGYLVVNGVKTEYEVNTEDVIEVVDGYLVVNGEKTEHKVYSEPVISVIDGYVAVNGVKTEYKVFADCEHTWETVTTEPTCTTEGYDTMTCLLCDKVVKTNMVEKLEHDYATTYMIDDNYHWYKCNYCAATSGKDLHTLDEEGVCTVCDLSVSSTPGVFYDLSDDKTYAMVVGYTGSATKVKIAEEYNGVPVKSIYDSAFSDCSGLTSVVIPDSVTSIGNSAFYGCSSLTSVVIPDSVTSIGINAFYGCHTSLYNEYEFSKYVGNENNPYFALVEITNKNMSTYTIHEDTKIIGGRVFSDCSRLSSITIPDSVTSIGYRAFEDCTSLTSVVIGDSVTSIIEFTFDGCSSLTDVYYTGSEEEWAEIEIGSYNSYLTNATIHYNYVPED